MSLFNIGGNTGYALGPIVVTPLVLWLGLGPGGLLAALPVLVVGLVALRALPYLAGFADRGQTASKPRPWRSTGRVRWSCSARSSVCAASRGSRC